MSSAPAPQFDPMPNDTPVDVPEPSTDTPIAESGSSTVAAPQPFIDIASDYISVVRLTRTWVQYGIFGFAVLCIVIGAVEALFGR